MSERSPIRNVILDVDGTLADSFNIFVESLEAVLQLPAPLSNKEIAELRGLTTRDIIAKLDIKKHQVPKLVTKGRKEVARRMHRVEAFPGIPEVVRDLSEDHKLFVLSSNSKSLVEDFLDRNQMTDSIQSIHTGVSIFGKAHRLRGLLHNEGLAPQETVYISDETRDIEAARNVGIHCVAVAWGYSTSEALTAHKPDALVRSPAEIRSALARIDSVSARA